MKENTQKPLNLKFLDFCVKACLIDSLKYIPYNLGGHLIHRSREMSRNNKIFNNKKYYIILSVFGILHQMQE